MGRRLRTAVLVYGGMAAAGVGWAAAAGHPIWVGPGWWDAEPASRVAASLLGGVLLALLVVQLTRQLVLHVAWAESLHIAFRSLLGPLRSRDVVFLACASGFAEELFFRGGMQPALGLPLTSLLFGVAHVGPSREFLPWTLWALVMGGLFGALHAVTGSLTGAVLAHALINYENMHFIRNYDPHAQVDGTGFPRSSLVGARRRSTG